MTLKIKTKWFWQLDAIEYIQKKIQGKKLFHTSKLRGQCHLGVWTK